MGRKFRNRKFIPHWLFPSWKESGYRDQRNAKRLPIYTAAKLDQKFQEHDDEVEW